METTEARSRPAVCDAGPIIHLDELDCLDLLEDFSPVLLPETVRHEIESHRPAALRRPQIAWRHTGPVGLTPPQLLAVARLVPLHAGEIEALHIATEHPGALLLTDDTAARLAARSLDIPVHGTVGILARSIRRRQRSSNAVVRILRELPRRSSLHVRPELLEHLIQTITASD